MKFNKDLKELKGTGKKKNWRDIFRFKLSPSGLQDRTGKELPTWDEFLDKMENSSQGEKEKFDFGLPKHDVFLHSPMWKNLSFILFVLALLIVGFEEPQYYQHIIYSVIAIVFLTAFATALKDSLFFHLETIRLRRDSVFINKFSEGEIKEREQRWLMKLFGKKPKNNNEFESELFRLHYQNVLRTFEQGERRSTVEQNHSLSEIYTIISQQGMKLVWTCVEILPQLGLIGTLAGLIVMLGTVDLYGTDANKAVMEGLGLALGTTIVANIVVLVLRPLYMQNERTMFQLLSAIQSLMGIFILPTQSMALRKAHDNTTVTPRALTELDYYNSNQQLKVLAPANSLKPELVENLALSLDRFSNLLSTMEEKKDHPQEWKELKEALRLLTSTLDKLIVPDSNGNLAKNQKYVAGVGEMIETVEQNESPIKVPNPMGVKK